MCECLRAALQTCEAFSANRYPFPEEATRQRQMHADVSKRLTELSSTLEAGTRRRNAVLENIAGSLQARRPFVHRFGEFSLIFFLYFGTTARCHIVCA